MKKIIVPFLSLLLLSFLVPIVNAQSIDIPERASVNDKYSNLKQILKCKKDRAQYGRFKDYGYWGGGPWCGKQGKAGYWVWVAPNWYVWANKGAAKPKVPPKASVHGKYTGLKQTLKCRKDREQYGSYKEWLLGRRSLVR